MPNPAKQHQPQPVKTPKSEAVVPDLVQLIHDRSTFGKQRYGVELYTFNGRDAYVDLLQELLDALQYQHQIVMEQKQREDDLIAENRRLWAIVKSKADDERENFHKK